MADTKIIVNCETGEVAEVELTADEIAQRAADAAVYMAGVTDPRTLANAFIAALIGPALKALDPKAKEFGVGKK